MYKGTPRVLHQTPTTTLPFKIEAMQKTSSTCKHLALTHQQNHCPAASRINSFANCCIEQTRHLFAPALRQGKDCTTQQQLTNTAQGQMLSYCSSFAAKHTLHAARRVTTTLYAGSDVCSWLLAATPSPCQAPTDDLIQEQAQHPQH